MRNTNRQYYGHLTTAENDLLYPDVRHCFENVILAGPTQKYSVLWILKLHK